MSAPSTVAAATDRGDDVTWFDVTAYRPDRIEALDRIVYPRSAETATDRIQVRYPAIERDRIHRMVTHARQQANAGRYVAAERALRDFEAYAAHCQPRGRRTVSPWLYRSVACLTGGLALFAGWVTW